MNYILNHISLARRSILWGITVYQKTLSPDHGVLRFLFPQGYCKFHPTCSEYGYRCIATYGLGLGGVKAIGRVLRCNPWSQGGVDHLT